MGRATAIPAMRQGQTRTGVRTTKDKPKRMGNRMGKYLAPEVAFTCPTFIVVSTAGLPLTRGRVDPSIAITATLGFGIPRISNFWFSDLTVSQVPLAGPIHPQYGCPTAHWRDQSIVGTAA